MSFHVTKELAFRNVFGMGCRFSTRLTMKAQQVRTTYQHPARPPLTRLGSKFSPGMHPDGKGFGWGALGNNIWFGWTVFTEKLRTYLIRTNFRVDKFSCTWSARKLVIFARIFARLPQNFQNSVQIFAQFLANCLLKQLFCTIFQNIKFDIFFLKKGGTHPRQSTR